MKLIVLLGLIWTSAAAEEEPGTREEEPGKPEIATVNGSYVLNRDNFDYVIKNEPFLIIYAYTSWCGHCKAFSPVWAGLAEKINKEPEYIHPTKAFSANIEDNPTIHNDWHTTSFPTIYYVRKGEYKQYNEKREEEALLKYIGTNEMDPVTSIYPEDLEDAVEGDEVAVVGKFASEEKAAMFESLAWKMELSSFYRVEDEEEVTVNEITVYSQHEGKPRTRLITDLDDQSAVKLQIAKYRRPYVIPFSYEAHSMTFEIPDRSVAVLLFHDKDEGSEGRLQEFGKVARAYSELYTFAEMRMDNEYVQKFTGHFNVKSSDLPIAFLVSTGSGGRMTKTKDLTESGLAQMIEDYRSGSAPTYQPSSGGSSEPDSLPEDWNTRPVVYLTSDNYLEVVLAPEHDVFVMWYRESCTHCKAMKPAWEELAVKYAEHPSLRVAHIKSSNLAGIPGMKIEKVPTMVLYKQSARGVGDGVEWEGKERTLEGLDHFLVENVFNVVQNEKDEL